MKDILSLYEECRLCPRNCGVNRLKGEKGKCGMTAELRAARAALHYWEEPCISGDSGSGTVFFSGCSLKCIYCQNHIISEGFGKVIDVERLSAIFLELESQGANNINLVTPTHFLPHIICAADEAKRKGLAVPFVYNTGGYEKPDMLELLSGTVSVFLTDFKYFSSSMSAEFSSAGDYCEVAKAGLEKMVEIAGRPVFSEDGLLKSGVIVRHMILPGHADDSKKVLGYLHCRYGDDVILSIMNQYTPVKGLSLPQSLSLKLSEEEYGEVLDFAEDIGISDAYIQEDETADESFIPPFDLTGI